MQDRRTILITGAAGNLGGLLSRHLVPTGHDLRLMYHRAPLPGDVARSRNVRAIKADLGDPGTLPARSAACLGARANEAGRGAAALRAHTELKDDAGRSPAWNDLRAGHHHG